MPIILQEFAVGDMNYISKHNANVSALLSFLAAVESSLASVSSGSSGLANSGNIGKATYGTSGMWFVGSGSFSDSTSGANLTLTSGFCWDGTLSLMHYQAASTVLSFTGKPPATYYIRFNGSDIPYVDDISTGAIYSVVWDGAVFGTITQLATVTPAAPDIGDLASSVYSGITYTTPAARLLATEKAFSDMLSADMSAANFTPTAAQAMEAAGLRLTGALTVSRTVTVPNKDKVYIVINECTTANASTVTVKTAAGTGIALLAGEHAVLYCDSTNVVHIFRQGANVPINSLLKLNDTPDTYTGQALRLVRVRADETGVELVTPGSVLTPSLVVKDEGTAVDSAVAGINFEGAGVAVTQTASGQVKVTVSGSASALAAQDEGAAVDSAVVLINFEGDGVTVTQTATGHILVTIPGTAGGAVDYDVSMYIADKRPSGAVAFRHNFTKAVDFAANFALSESDAVVAATASAVFLVKKNGTQVGTLTFAAAGTVGTFATSGGAAVSFVVGDILEITAPTPQDATLSGVSITLAGVRA
jgi:hypothetical protein